MPRIIHNYETLPDGTRRLHADNSNHPGITEQDIEEVLLNVHLAEPVVAYPGQIHATGATSGQYPILTVALKRLKGGNWFAITAWPAKGEVAYSYLQMLRLHQQQEENAE